MNIAIIGGGDHALEILSYLNDDNLFLKKTDKIFIVDKKRINLSNFKLINKKVIYSQSVKKIKKIKNLRACISVGEPNLRFKCFKELKKNKIKMFSIIHNTSYVSKFAKISNGVIIAPKCVIAPFAEVKENILINSGSVVGHHATIEKHSVLNPNSFLAGRSKIGLACMMGANSSIMPSVNLNNFSRLSASSVLYNSAPSHSLSHGNPAKSKKYYVK